MTVVDGYGYIHISRKAYAEDVFWLEPRTFSRWEAWEDMIQLASHSDRTWSSGPHRPVLQLKRGETRPLSYSFLAKRWNWTVKRVRRFVSLLAEMGRAAVQQVADDGHTYLLVNYECYQGAGHERGTSGARAGHERGTSGARNRSKEKEGEEGEEGTEAPRGAPLLPFDAKTALYNEGLAIVSTMSGKPVDRCRPLVGKWLRDAGDDAARVLNLLRSAQADRRADLISWIEACLKPRDPDEEIYRGIL